MALTSDKVNLKTRNTIKIVIKEINSFEDFLFLDTFIINPKLDTFLTKYITPRIKANITSPNIINHILPHPYTKIIA